MSDASRREQIAARLSEHVLHVLGCAAVTPSMEAWQNYNVTTTQRFGWMPPIAEDEMLLTYSYCPELIAAVTAHLDEAGLDLYLTVVETFFDGWADPPVGDWDKDYQDVLDLLSRDQPDIVRFKEEVELHALDTGIVVGGLPTDL